MPTEENMRPKSFSFNNTERCQSRCITCGAWQTPASVMENELSTQEWKDIIFKLQEWLGNFSFIFSGGEPFLRDDIIEIAQFAKGIGVNVDVITNGLSLFDKYEKIIDSQAFGSVTFSLNSIENPHFHIESRGRKDSFKKTIDAINNLNYLNKKKNAGINFFLSALVMPSNLSEVGPIAEFAKTQNMGVTYQLLDNGDAFTGPYGENIEDKSFNSDVIQKAIEAIELMIELKKQNYPIFNSFSQLEGFKDLISRKKYKAIGESTGVEVAENQADCAPDKNVVVENNLKQQNVLDMPCQVGYNNFSIDPYGNVRICFCYEPIGSLRESSPKDLWESEKANLLREKILKCPRSCKLLNCNFKE